MEYAASDRSAISTRPEDLFVELFAQVFGVEGTRLLTPQFAVEDIYGSCRLIDFALRTVDERVAFEIDGLIWHVPDAERIAQYENQLLRQNSLVHQGGGSSAGRTGRLLTTLSKSRNSSPSSSSESPAC
jgi:hypothetical protein